MFAEQVNRENTKQQREPSYSTQHIILQCSIYLIKSCNCVVEIFCILPNFFPVVGSSGESQISLSLQFAFLFHMFGLGPSCFKFLLQFWSQDIPFLNNLDV